MPIFKPRLRDNMPKFNCIECSKTFETVHGIACPDCRAKSVKSMNVISSRGGIENLSNGADRQRIIELEAKLKEAEWYKEQWQSIAGAANLKHLVKSANQLEQENKQLREALDWALRIVYWDYMAFTETAKKCDEYRKQFKMDEQNETGES